MMNDLENQIGILVVVVIALIIVGAIYVNKVNRTVRKVDAMQRMMNIEYVEKQPGFYRQTAK